jgi:hypothetical protein
MKPFRHLRTALLGCLLVAAPAMLGQTVTGNITGVVTDPNGAVVSGATVMATNTDTNVVSQTTTNKAGAYTIQFLPIGPYKVSVTAPGFSEADYPPFTLNIDQTVKINAHLKPGTVSTRTVVQGAITPLLNTSNASIGLTLSGKQLQSIPLNGENFSSATLFVPGAISTYGPSGMTGNNAIERSTFLSDIPNINGNRAQANNYTIDGIDNNENENNLIGYNLAPQAIQQQKIITSNAPAEYGNVNGGDVLLVMKSGTNQFHGQAYIFFQNQNMNANSWGNKHNTPIVPRNPYDQTQFGGTLGGPIKHNKLFFFVDYEGARQHTGGTGTASLLTPAMRQGDFSILLHPPAGTNGVTATPIQLYDTQNNFAPYANNQIPILSPVAKFIFANPSLYPLPNATPQDGITLNNYQGPQRTFTVNNQGDVKIQWNPRGSDTVTGFYSESQAYDGNISLLPISFPPQNSYPTHLGGADWVHIFSQALVNSARVGFTRIVWYQGVPTDPTGLFGTDGDAKVGIPLPSQSYPGFSYQGINGVSGVGNPANIGSLIDNTYTYGDNLTWQRGLHLFSMGIQALRYQNNYITSNNQGFLGSFNYNGEFTSNPFPNAVNGAGYGPADFVLDRVQSANVEEASVLVGQRQWRTAGFFQDDWKIKPNLTLNLGIRYEYDQPWYEVNNKTGNVVLSGPNAGQVIYAGRVPAGAPPGSGVCSNRACYQPTYNQIMPRLGFAYQPVLHTVIRGGYGSTSFFEGNAGNQRLTSIIPFIQSSFNTAVAPSVPSGPNSPPAGGIPLSVQQGFSSNPANINYSGGGYGAWPQNMQPAYIQEWNLTVDQQLTNTTAFWIAYVGEDGQRLIDYRNANQLLAPNAFNTAPLAKLVGPGGSVLLTEPEAKMNYNALEAVLRQETYRGLNVVVNYTYSKTQTNSLGNYTLNSPSYNFNGGAFQNGYDGAADMGPAGTDARHNLSALVDYQVPFGRGQQYGGDINRIEDAFLGGWTIDTATSAHTGFPLTILATNVSSNTNTFGTERANQYRELHVVNRNINHWFGTDPSAQPCTQFGVDNGLCAYGFPAANTFGSARVGTERIPGYLEVDASLFKQFHIVGEQLAGFRVDAFNVFNISSYGAPDPNLQDSTFGQITSVNSPPRSLQLSLDYEF